MSYRRICIINVMWNVVLDYAVYQKRLEFFVLLRSNLTTEKTQIDF